MRTAASSASETLMPVGYAFSSSTALIVKPVRVLVFPIRLTMTARLTSGLSYHRELAWQTARESGCHRQSYREHQDSHWLNDQCRTGRKRVPDRHQSLGCGTRCRSHKASQIPWRLELHDIAQSIECHWIHKIGKVILRQCLIMPVEGRHTS